MKPVVALFVLVFVAACGRPIATPKQVPIRTGHTIPITINNPYGITIEIELKCDGIATGWVLPSKSSVVVWVPSDAARCEIWPKVKLWR